MLTDIGCNLLDAFDRIFERTGEDNPNSIFEAKKKPASSDAAVPPISAGDVGDVFGPDSPSGKENRVKLAQLVYGDGEPFTIEASGDIPWTLVFNKDGDQVVTFDEGSKTVTINAKRAAYKSSVAKFLAEGLKNRKYTNIHKSQKNSFQDAINQMLDYVKKAADGKDMSIEALDKAAKERAEKAKATREKNKQAKQEQKPDENQQPAGDEMGQGVPPESKTTEPKKEEQPKQEQPSNQGQNQQGNQPQPDNQQNQQNQPQPDNQQNQQNQPHPDNQQNQQNQQNQPQPEDNQPKTQQQMYKEFVAKFKEDYTDRIPADCNNPQMTQNEINEKADEYFNAIQSPILDDADDDTRNAAYRYIQAAISQHVRSLNGNNNQQGNQNGGENPDDKDDFNWGGDDGDDDLDGKGDDKNKKDENSSSKSTEPGYFQRILDTADKYQKTFSW